MKTGRDLRNWRQQNRLTQKQLAKKINYSASRLSHIESNDEKLSSRLLYVINTLDQKLNPPVGRDSISQKIHHMRKSIRNFNKELAIIETAIVDLLNVDVAKDDVREAYLKFLSAALREIKCLSNLTYTDDKQLNDDITPHFKKIRSATNLYVKKKFEKQ